MLIKLYKIPPSYKMSLRSIKYVAQSETLDPGYDTFLINASEGNIIFTLSDIINDGESYWIKRIDSSSNTVTVEGYTESQIIEGQTSINLTPGARIIVVSSYNAATDTYVWYYF